MAYFSFTAARFQPDTLLPVGDYPSPAATTTSFTWIPTRREASAWNKSNGARDFLVRIRFLTLITPSVIAFPPLARKGRVVFSRSRRYRRRGWPLKKLIHGHLCARSIVNILCLWNKNMRGYLVEWFWCLKVCDIKIMRNLFFIIFFFSKSKVQRIGKCMTKERCNNIRWENGIWCRVNLEVYKR